MAFVETARGERAKTQRRKTILVVAILSTLTIALLLIFQVQSGLPLDLLPSFGLSVGRAGSSDNARKHANNNKYRLNPQDHVFRNATIQIHHWRVTADNRRPDGVLKRIYLVNAAFPGPTLEARPGDRLIIHVENALEDEGLSMHWHGLSMRGTNDMDGAVGVTQDPIRPGDAFTYDFSIEPDQKGTFWYHAHDGVQRADGLYGGLVVHEPLIDGDSQDLATEHLLLVGDWYHRSAREALEFYMHPGAFGLETVPDSILVHGEGAFKCSDAVPARPIDCSTVKVESMSKLNLDTAVRNILRVVNVGAYAGFSVAVDGSQLTPLTLDSGHKIFGSPSKSVGFLHPGERVDILLELDPVVAHYRSYLQITLDEKPFKYQNPALTAAHRFPLHWHGELSARSESTKGVYETFDIQTAKSTEDQSKILPSKANHTILLYTLTQKLAHLDNEPHGFINHTTWQPQSPPLIHLHRDKWDKHQFVPYIDYDAAAPVWVDIVLNNLDEDWHPFHLHGYNFWVLSQYSSTFNWGSYNPFEDIAPPGGDDDLAGAVRRDTFYVPRRGYAILRFRADNKGLWMFHCHVLWHQASGMSMAIQVGT